MNINITNKTSGKSSGLTSTQHGVYEERCWYNDTSSTVVVIDSNNVKTEIPPRSSSVYGPKVVRFQRRHGVGPTKSDNGINLNLDYEEIIIKESDLLVEPVFVREVNVIVCSIALINSVDHPYSSACYNDIFNRSVELFETTFRDSPGVSFVANDPQKRFSEVFTYLYDCPVCIPVTSIINDTSDATLTCIFTTIDGIYKQEINIEELVEKQTLPIKNEIIPVVSMTRLGAQQYVHSHQVITQEDYDDAIKRMELLHKKALDNVKKQADLDRDSYSTKLKNAELEADEYKTKYQSLKAHVDAAVDYRTADLKQEQMINATRQAELKLESEYGKQQYQNLESKLKLWHLVAAALLPVAIKTVGLWIKHSMTEK